MKFRFLIHSVFKNQGINIVKIWRLLFSTSELWKHLNLLSFKANLTILLKKNPLSAEYKKIKFYKATPRQCGH